MKLFVHCHPKISSRAGNQAQVSRAPARCCNYHILRQSDLSNPLRSLETSYLVDHIFDQFSADFCSWGGHQF